jgi:hypothetical protein
MMLSACTHYRIIQVTAVSAVSTAADGSRGDYQHAVLGQLKEWSVTGSFLQTSSTQDSVMYVRSATSAADCTLPSAETLSNGDVSAAANVKRVDADGVLRVVFGYGSGTQPGVANALQLCYKHGAEPFMLYDRYVMCTTVSDVAAQCTLSYIANLL